MNIYLDFVSFNLINQKISHILNQIVNCTAHVSQKNGRSLKKTKKKNISEMEEMSKYYINDLNPGFFKTVTNY